MSHFRQLLHGFFALAALIAIGQLTTHCALAQDDVFTDPMSAGAEYAFQGEYVGSLEAEGMSKDVGVHVIALGDGKFRAYGYLGGLPGNRDPEDVEEYDADDYIEGELRGDKVVFEADEVTAEIVGETMTIAGENDDGRAELKRVIRKSPSLGAEPPEGATVLFDGTNADQFENGKLVEGQFLGATNCHSKLLLGDHHLHIEFRTPFMPKARGQGRGNSGVYVQGRYEVQVLDSFGLEGKNNECGGIYSIAEPLVNMCFPPLSWQTYDIDFTAAKYENGEKVENARVTVKHNGVVIHDDVELPNGTPGRLPEGPEPAGLFLQDHGNPVVFRNIWVVEK